jgi:hypothetical protein
MATLLLLLLLCPPSVRQLCGLLLLLLLCSAHLPALRRVCRSLLHAGQCRVVVVMRRARVPPLCAQHLCHWNHMPFAIPRTAAVGLAHAHAHTRTLSASILRREAGILSM